MLPTYSKKSDHEGPLSGNISPLPRTSRPVPGNAGSIRQEQMKAMKVSRQVERVPSQRSMSDKKTKDTMPIKAPITTMGCRRMSLRLKNPFMVSDLPQRSS